MDTTRKKGTPNKATADIKALASVHGAESISELERLMREGENEQTRLAACGELLDRGYRRARQTLDVNENRLDVLIVDRFGERARESDALADSTLDARTVPAQAH